MATFIAIRNVKQTRGAMAGAIGYIAKDEKTLWKGISLVAGHNRVPQSSYIEFLTTKKRFHKTEGRQFYHFVQSFAEGDRLSPQLANAIGVELAEQEFPDFEVLVATHIDTGHLHNHMIVNSVSCVDGRKLHQNTADLQHHRDMNDQICLAHGLSVLPKSRKHNRKKRMEPGEYQAGLRGESWKLELVFILNQALREAEDKESFIEWLEREGYRCRDSSLHDETFLKDNLEYLFLYRQLTNFEPGREEPSYGWLYGVTYNAEALTGYLEQAMDVPDPPLIPVWTESKQRQREALKKLAHGQRLENIESFEEDEGYDFGMSM